MTRYVDIVRWHDGTTGPAGMPAECVEHDGTRPLRAGEQRMTVDDYRARQPGWRQDYEDWAARRPPPAEPPPAATAPRIIRALAFLDRLSPRRQADIVAAARQATARGDPTAELLLLRLGAATEVNLDDPRVTAAVHQMQAAGLVTPDEAAALLADPAPDEVP